MKTAPQTFWNYVDPKRPQRSSLTLDECCARATLLNNYFESVFIANDNRDPPFDYVCRCPNSISGLIITEAGVLALLLNPDTKKCCVPDNITNTK